MSRYRKVLTRFWYDEKVRPLDADGKLLFLYHLTSPQSTPFLLYVEGAGALSNGVRLTAARTRKAMRALTEAGLVMYSDDGSDLLLLPKALRIDENAPNGPNAVKSWVGLFGDLPSTTFRRRAVDIWSSLEVVHRDTRAFIDTVRRYVVETPSGYRQDVVATSSRHRRDSEAVAVSDTETEAVTTRARTRVADTVPGDHQTIRTPGCSLSRTTTTRAGARHLADVVMDLRAKEGKA